MQKQASGSAKAGFGNFKTPYEYAPYIEMARRHDMITMVHTGGSSIPGSTSVAWADHVLKMMPGVSYHIERRTHRYAGRGFPRAWSMRSKIAMQVCTAEFAHYAFSAARSATLSGPVCRSGF